MKSDPTPKAASRSVRRRFGLSGVLARIQPGRDLRSALAAPAAAWLSLALSSLAAEAPVESEADSSNPAAEGAPTADAARPMYIREFRVAGSNTLPPVEVEQAVYPFLGPGRTAEDVEHARAALEKAYWDTGYQSVTVEAPQQRPRRGIIVLQVQENKVGRVRVKDSRYFSLDQIKRHTPSLTAGVVPNYNDITRDMLALNQWPDRQITPVPKPGAEPGTIDVDLNVQDTFPLHGSLELNNRYSPGTTELRLNGSVSYDNLWQLGHSIGFSFQLAPERLDDAEVFSAYYLARFANVPWLSLILQGTKQNSNVSTLGGAANLGRGEIMGVRAVATLPAAENFYHSFTLGFDYKRFDEEGLTASPDGETSVTYFPLSLAYSATWSGKKFLTELNAAANLHLRGLGSGPEAYEERRYHADGGSIYFRGDLSHTQDLAWDFKAFGKVLGQISSGPLLNSEQFSVGGLGTARGYLESTAVGDNALFGTLELRSPSLLRWWGAKDSEWRVYAFLDAGFLTVSDPLPEQTSRFELASWGVGSSFRLLNHLNGSIDAGIPLIDQGETSAGELRFTFRLWAEF